MKLAALLLIILSISKFALAAADSAPSRSPQSSPPPALSPDYKLAWADEFNADGPPDPKNWVFEHGFVRNDEDQYYQPENARCEKGLLVIEGRRETRPNPQYREGARSWKESRPNAQYTSACIKTAGLHSWLYGRFEMRGRIPVADGMWPAFWTLGFARPWPGCGEVDIMEYYRRILLANVLLREKGNTARTPLADLGGEAWARDFHVWRMDWDKDLIRIWVDDRLLNETTLQTRTNRDGSNPFREPHYILLNLAIGGRQGTNQPSQGLADPSQTKFPVRFEVDYVRVYQKQN